MFEFWAYTPLVCILAAPLVYSLICDGPVETDHFTNTRGYSYFIGRYWYMMVFALLDLLVRETGVVHNSVTASTWIRSI